MVLDKEINLFGYNNINKMIFFRIITLISPIFFLTVKHWTNLIVIVLSIGSINYLITKSKPVFEVNSFKSRRFAVCLIFAGFFLSVLISQTLRFNFYTPNLDAPLRMLLCIPIFLAISKGWLVNINQKSISKLWFVLIFPLTLLCTFLFRICWPTVWGSKIDNIYYTTYFVDPLTFGSYNILFTLIVLLGLTDDHKKFNLTHKIICLTACLSGIYLSLTSGARTGLLVVPLFLFIWFKYILIPVLRLKEVFVILLILLISICIFLFSSNYLANKIILAFSELSNYHFYEMNLDNSTAMRLSIYRMGITYFFESPWYGWGDTGWLKVFDNPKFLQYATEFTRLAPINGFHNEIITNSVRSGIWGLLASISFFLVIVLRAIQGLKLNTSGEHRLVSITILLFISHLFLAGLTTEITNLVFLSSFIGLTLAVLLGEQIYLEEKLSLHAKI